MESKEKPEAAIDQNGKDPNKDFTKNLVETNIRCIGDKTTVCQIVELLAFIRNSVANNREENITVKIGHKVANAKFLFDVNQLEIPDLKTQPVVEIN
jgi:hypothetical protein